MKFLTAALTLALASLAFISQAQAVSAYSQRTKISFVVSSFAQPLERTYYNCDALEDTARTDLKQLGFTRISARCTGEIMPDQPVDSPLLSLQFDSLSENGKGTPIEAAWSTVTFRSRGFSQDVDCNFTQQFMHALARKGLVRDVKGPGICPNSHFGYSYSVSVLKAR